MQALEGAAASDPAVAARLEHLVHRVPEELYDYESDPDALRNRIADPSLAETLRTLRRALASQMLRTGDPALGAFRQRIDELEAAGAR